MIDPVTNWKVYRLGQGPIRFEDDPVAEEASVGLIFAGQPAAELMASPGREPELAAGFALTMGWAQPGDPPPVLSWDPDSRQVLWPAAPPQGGLNGGIRAAGGGPLGPLEAQPVSAEFTVEIEVLLNFTQCMSQKQALYAHTGATHAAALFSPAGEFLMLAEDVGRHNALDKALGGLWLAGRLGEAGVVSFSGRLSLEMVLKAGRAGMGLLTAVSAPTAPAVRKAEELGITLCGYSRQARMNVYTHPRRVVQQGQPLSEL